MPRHDPTSVTASASAALDMCVPVSAVSYLSQFPEVSRVLDASEPLVPITAMEAEQPRLPAAHRFSS